MGEVEGVVGVPHDGQKLTLAANWLPHFAQKGKSYPGTPIIQFVGLKILYALRNRLSCIM